MSVNPSILEGGQARYFGATDYLRTVTGNSDCLWVPEADRQLGRKHITRNGAYVASADGEYGWSEVTVNVSQTDSVTGTDPDTGKETVVRKDPVTGDLVWTTVAVEIRVTTQPTKLTYATGERIDLGGIGVTAYDSDGDPLQTVLEGQLTPNPSNAGMTPGTQTVTVGWERAGDGAVLEATFTITVTG